MTAPFKYAAVDGGGAKRAGVVVAASEADAAELLSRAGLTPLRLAPGAPPRRPRAKIQDRAAAMRPSAANLSPRIRGVHFPP